MGPESFSIAFDDLIDGMDDEAETGDNREMEHRARIPEETASLQTTQTDISSALAADYPNSSASTVWQQNILDVQAKLLGDLQHNPAR